MGSTAPGTPLTTRHWRLRNSESEIVVQHLLTGFARWPQSLFDYPLPESFHFPPITNQPGPSFALFPAQDMGGESWANRPFTQAELDGLRAGKKRIYIYGTARYRDVFRCNRHANFSASVRADSDTLIKLTSSYIPDDLQVTFEACAEFGTAA